MAGTSRNEGVSPLPHRHVVGHYRILAEVGSGGMGIVYRAEDINLGREVALKSPWPELAGKPEHRRRFLKEARSASALSHPNIVQLFEVFEDAGRPWIAMEFVDGPSLRAILKARGALGLRDVLRYAEDLASALKVAHARRILHRDVSPGNILVGSDGRARLTDFGLAGRFVPPDEISEASTQTPGMTEPGMVVGTPGYMAPEQALGHAVDQRSDLFSLGAVLYEMATGHPAFTSSQQGGLIDAVLNREPRPMSRHSYEVPEELERIVRKCLAKDPAERYQGAADLIADLKVLRRRIELPSGIAHPADARSVRRWWTGGLSLTAALAFVVVTWLIMSQPGEPPLQRGVVSRQITTSPGWETEPALSPDGGLIGYVSNEAGNTDIWLVDARGGAPLRLTDHPGKDVAPAWVPDGSALIFVSDRDGKDAIWKVPRLGGAATLVLRDGVNPAVSPDGRRIGFARVGPSGQTRIAVAPMDAPDEARFLTDEDDGLWEHDEPAWSPDGLFIAYAAFRDLWVVPSEGGTARRITTGGSMDRRPVWSPDGNHVYFASDRERTQAIWRVLADGSAPERVTMGTGPETHPTISADGRTMAYSTHVLDPDLTILDLRTGERTRFADARVDAEPSFAPDGSALAFKSDRWGGRVDLWIQPLNGARTSGPARRLTDHPGAANHPSWSPDGRWVAYYRVIDQQRDIWVVSTSGGAPIQFTTDPAADLHPEWSPDGTRLAFVSERDGASHIWVAPIAEGRPAGTPRRISSGDSIDVAPVWSPDGSQLAYIAVMKAQLDVWIAGADGSEPPRRLTTGAQATRVRWHPAGDRLLASGNWGEEPVSIRIVSLEDGGARHLGRPLLLGPQAQYTDFAISPDGNLLAFTAEESHGDVWMIEASDATF